MRLIVENLWFDSHLSVEQAEDVAATALTGRSLVAGVLASATTPTRRPYLAIGRLIYLAARRPSES